MTISRGSSILNVNIYTLKEIKMLNRQNKIKNMSVEVRAIIITLKV